MSTVRRPSMLAAAVLAAAFAVPATPAAAGSSCAGANLVPTQENVRTIRAATRCLINKERRSRGRRPLSASGGLNRAAQLHSDQMVSQSFFDHVSPSGTTLLDRVLDTTNYLVDVTRYALGENIAWGSGVSATPRQTMRSWMLSPGHKRNILDRRYRHVGVGIAIGAPRDVGNAPAATYTTEFGMRR